MEEPSTRRPALLEILATHAAEFDLDSAPAGVIDRVKLCLLDLLGCLLAGSGTEPARRVAGLAEKQGGPPQASVVGRPGLVPAESAALTNGVAAHSLELDDAHRFATGYHPGATLIPAALAAAEMTGASGRRFLESLVVGYDVGGRIGTALNPSHRYRGFHSTGTIGPFGATAAAAHLLGLDAPHATAALALAASQGSGIFEFLSDSSPVKLLHAGWSAQKGVQAALLAEAGMAGPPTALEGREGFARAYADRFRLDGVAEQLGRRFEVEWTYFKIHSACGHSFSAVDAALELRKELLDARGDGDVEKILSAIESIRVRAYRAAAVLDHQEPATEAQCRFSIPYCVGAALALGSAGPEAFTPEARNSPVIRRIARLTNVEENAALTAAFPSTRTAIVEIALTDGRRLSRTVDYPRGTPENPVGEEKLEAKFHLLAGSRLDATRRRELTDEVRYLEKAESLSRLTSYLRE